MLKSLQTIPGKSLVRSCRHVPSVRSIRSLAYRPSGGLFRSPFDDPFFQIPSILHSTLPSMLKEQESWIRPALDVSDTPTHYKIKVELPGMDEEAVKLSLKNDILTIEGERELEKVQDNETRYIKESSYGAFSRQISMPSDADIDQIRATMNKGILEVLVGKKPEAQVPEAKTIPIQSSDTEST